LPARGACWPWPADAEDALAMLCLGKIRGSAPSPYGKSPPIRRKQERCLTGACSPDWERRGGE